MRRKKTADPVGYGRLLDAWIPPAKAGEAFGCFATTFTFHASFFETECVGRMLQLECDPDTSGAAYLVEREEKMARLKSACVVVDRAHARGQRSLRWDLIPFRTNVGILHAKLSILLWQHHARVIVASANLTENGYRQNLEVFTVWDFHQGGSFPAELFGAATDFASDVLAQCESQNQGKSPAWDRSREFLTAARRRVSSWLPADSSTPRLRSALVPVTPASLPVFDQLINLWPSASRPGSLFVLSPFFDQAPKNAPATLAWDMLRQRGDAEILYSVVAESIRASEKLLVHAPASLAKSLPVGGPNAKIAFERIEMPENRALHAKSLWLENTEHFLHLIGSSNFTSAGLGIGANRNWELNVASWARLDNREEFSPRNAAWPERESEPIDPKEVDWEPYANLEDDSDPKAPLLPNWCGSAVYFLKPDGQAALELNIGDNPPEEWSILDGTGTRPLLTAGDWRLTASPSRVELSWPDDRPPTELAVRVAGLPGEARWPVEVRSFADLPPPQELRDLTLEQLLHILTSALPLHRCLQKRWRQHSDEATPAVPAVTLDPLRRFQRDTHLLERTRRFSLAMTGMRQRLENPIPSEEYLQWRLHGPVGVAKVAAAILKEAGSDGEKAFLLGELALELSQVQSKSEPGFLSKKRIQEAIATMVIDFEKQAAPLLDSTETDLQDYVRTALKKARA
jgi:HKD family nuclease